MLERLRQIAKLGDVKVMAELLQNKNILKIIATEENAVLMQAVRYNQLPMVEYLLTIKEVQDAIAVNNNAILVLAVDHGHIIIVECLLKFKAVQEVFKVNNHRELEQAVLKRRQSVIYRLVLAYRQLGISLPNTMAIEITGFGTLALSNFIKYYEEQLQKLRIKARNELLLALKDAIEAFATLQPLVLLITSYVTPPNYLPNGLTSLTPIPEFPRSPLQFSRVGCEGRSIVLPTAVAAPVVPNQNNLSTSKAFLKYI